MHETEDTPGTSNSQVNMTLTTTAEESYGVGEVVWGIFLLIGIFTINISVLWVVSRSRELWKPRHLWMACLCVTDIFVGAHKALELLIVALPYTHLCVLKRATLGIPYAVNMLILSLLSLDRFIAVRYPFFYSASVSNKHVMIGFLIVLMAGGCLAAVSISMELQQPDPICRMHYTMPSDMLVYLTIVLTICSVLTLVFNSSVLRIAKQQLNAIYAQDPSLTKGRRRVSVVCTNCGYKNETFVNTLLPISPSQNGNMVTKSTSMLPQRSSPAQSSILPLTDAVVLGPLDLEINLKNYDNQLNGLGSANTNMHVNCDSDDSTPLHLIDETTTPLVRTVSLPTIHDTVSLPISVVVQPDPALPPAVVIGNVSTDVDLACQMVSVSNIDNNSCKTHAPVTNETPGVATSGIQPGSVVPGRHLLPRSRSLMTCRAHKIIPQSSAVPRLQLFRNLQFARTHMFHVGRLFPSIRFARTVLLIMIPMWVFILPIVTIIPLYRGCERAGNSDLNCKVVGYMWRYLFVHMRSILPLQAIIDTLIYAFGSKEFRQALKKLMRKIRQPKQ